MTTSRVVVASGQRWRRVESPHGVSRFVKSDGRAIVGPWSLYPRPWVVRLWDHRKLGPFRTPGEAKAAAEAALQEGRPMTNHKPIGPEIGEALRAVGEKCGCTWESGQWDPCAACMAEHAAARREGRDCGCVACEVGNQR